jgi:hypothetical protein
MITEETKERFHGKMGVEYRVNKQAVEKKPATELPKEIKQRLILEQYLMELLLVYEVIEWEQCFWNKFGAFLDQIDQEEVKERLTREKMADCWTRLNPQMHAAQKRMTDFDSDYCYILRAVGELWASCVSQFFEGVEKYAISVFDVREDIETMLSNSGQLGDEIRPRIENEIEDTEFRLKRGSDLGRFDQFWDHESLFECRYSRSKWLYFNPYAPLEIHEHALKRNKNIIHISFHPDFDVDQFRIRDLPWVNSISSSDLPAIHHTPIYQI